MKKRRKDEFKFSCSLFGVVTSWRSTLSFSLILVCLGVSSAAANRVTIRDDRTVLIDGKPFFPIGLYYPEEELADESGALLKDLRSTGFNTIFFITDNDPLGPKTKATLDRVAAAGLHTQWRPPGQLTDSFDLLRKTVAAYKDHPAMLFWEHSDEPMVNNTKFEQCEPGYKLMKEIDPDHPVLMIEYPYWKNEADLKRFATITDVYGFDKYPIPLKRWYYQGADIPNGWPHSIAIMGELAEWWQKLAPGKPTLSVLQAWNRKPQEDGKAGYPTTEQSRFMAYQSVIRGAKGILYYGKIRVKTPHTPSSLPPEINPDPKILERDFKQAVEMNDAFWAEFKKVVKEMDGMTPVFTARDEAWAPAVKLEQAPGVKPTDIQLRTKKVGDGWVMMLVNASDKPATVTLSAPQLAPGKVQAWNGTPAPKVTDAGLAETIEPFGVRVYSDHAQPAK